MDETPKVRAKKRRVPIFLKIVLIILAIPVILAAIAGIEFLVAKQNPWDFIPRKFQVYLQVPSIRTVYDEWINLDALQLVFKENRGLSGLQDAMLKLKASGLGSDSRFQTLIDVEAHVVLGRSNEIFMVLDLGWRSMITRQAPLFSGLINVSGLSTIQKNGHTYFKYSWAKDSSVFVCFVDNLALIAFSESGIDSMLSLKSGDAALSGIDRTRIVDEFSRGHSGSLRFLADPSSLFSTYVTDSGTRARVDSALDWKDQALVSVDIDNKKFSMNAATLIASKNEILSPVVSRQSQVLSSLRYMPESTYFYSAFNVGDFQQTIRTYSLFTGQNFDSLLKNVEDGSKFLLDMNLDQVLWSWIGNEAGVSYLGDSPDPVFYVNIKDESARQAVFKKLNDSAVLDIDKSLVLDGVPIARLAIPPFIKGLLGLFKIDFDTPYYLVMGNTLFFSMSAENLARLSNETRSGKVLYRSPGFESLTSDTPKNPVLFVYYDLDKSTPFFLKGRNLLADILKLYNRGALSVFNDKGYLSLNMVAGRVESKGTVPFPGFPITLAQSLTGAPLVSFLPRRSDPTVAFVHDDTKLALRSLASGDTVFETDLEAGSRVLDLHWAGDLAAWSPGGTVYRIDQKGALVNPFPILSPSQGSFVPTAIGNTAIFYARTAQSLFALSADGKTAAWGPALEDPVLSPPTYSGNLVAFSTKDFGGHVYLADSSGSVQNGWPQSGGGISLSSPVVSHGADGTIVAFLTQNGNLNVWNTDGTAVPGFPTKLSGVFYAEPAPLRLSGGSWGIAVLDTSGNLSIVDKGTKVLRSLALRSGGTEAKILVHDVDSDGIDELFIYGGMNSIAGYSSALETLPGFPVNGSFKPAFLDMNLDGGTEMVAGAYDGKLYAYTIRK